MPTDRKKLLTAGGLAGGLVIILLGVIVFISMQNNNPQNNPEDEIVRELVNVDFAEETIEDDNLFTDDNPVRVQIGIPGQLEEVYRVEHDKDGNITDRELIETNTIIEKQDRITRVGTLDREQTERELRDKLQLFFARLEDSGIGTVYDQLSSTDRELYPLENLEASLEQLDWRVTNQFITDEIDYAYPEYLTDKDASLAPIQEGFDRSGQTTGSDTTTTQGLVARIPLSLTFDSSVIGEQVVEFDLRLVRENGDWFIRYFGPTEVIEIDRSLSREDGGKVFGEPVRATATLGHVAFFEYWDRLYFDYLLENNSERNFRTTATGEEEFVPTDAFISQATLYDDPDTPYELLENVLFEQSEDKVWVDREAKGRLIYSPTPGLAVERIYLSLQLTIDDGAQFDDPALAERETTSFVVNMNFGEIALDRQNRQAELQSEDTIRDEPVVSEETAPMPTDEATP